MKKVFSLLAGLSLLALAIGCGEESRSTPSLPETTTPALEETPETTPSTPPRTMVTPTLSPEIEEWSVVHDEWRPVLRVIFNEPLGGAWKLINPDGDECGRDYFPSGRTVACQMAEGTPLSGRYTLTGEKYSNEVFGPFYFDFEGPELSLVTVKYAVGYVYVELKNSGDLPMYINDIEMRRPEAEYWTSFYSPGLEYIMPGETKVISGHVLTPSKPCYDRGEEVEVKLTGRVAGEFMEILKQEAVLGQPLTQGEE